MKKISIAIFFFSFLLGIWYSCEKEPVKYEVTISVSDANTPASGNSLKSIAAVNLDLADKIIVTIQFSDGTATPYLSAELGLYKVNDIYFSQKIALVQGDYKITEFHLIDESNNIIYAVPLEGSELAQNVGDPLPILFSVTKDESTPIEVEVISTEELDPADFGLAGQTIEGIPTFSFMVCVVEQGTYSILEADLTVTAQGYQYTKSLEAIATNVVTLKDSIGDYTITISKQAYEEFEQVYTSDGLKAFDTIPLIVELAKTQQAGLLFWNKLGSQSEVESSEIGPGGTYTAGSFVPGKFGNALRCGQTTAGGVRFPAAFANLDSGTVDLWAKLEGYSGYMASGAGGDPEFITITNLTGFAFCGNDGGAGGGLIGWALSSHPGSGNFGSYTYSQFLGSEGVDSWHHYAMVWNVSGIPEAGGQKACIYLDGVLNSTHWWEATPPGFDPNAEIRLIWSDHHWTPEKFVVIDNIKVWDYAKTDFSDRFSE